MKAIALVVLLGAAALGIAPAADAHSMTCVVHLDPVSHPWDAPCVVLCLTYHGSEPDPHACNVEWG